MLGEHAIPNLKSGADLTADANQYKLVKLDANGDVVLADTQGEQVIGVLYNKPNTGQAADVRYGVVKVQADAAINEMVALTPQTDGQAMAAVTGDFPCGYALSAPSGAGVLFDAYIAPSGAVAVA